MNREKKQINEAGFTLIEVLLSITILGILLLFILSYFQNAYAYTKRNEDKTVAVNVARNALMYMEKQNFIELREYFLPALDGDTANAKKLSLQICSSSDGTDSYRYLDASRSTPSACHPIHVNDTDYSVTISAMKQLENRNFYIPIIVEVSWETNGETKSTKLEGNIKSEDIR